MAGELQSCSSGLIDLLDLRLPVECSTAQALAALQYIRTGHATLADATLQTTLQTALAAVVCHEREALAHKLAVFEQELTRTGRPFTFTDCSLGNLVFAGCFLEMGRDFNRAIADYCALLNLPSGLIENVTDGANAYLVALDSQHRLLASEADIVDANRHNHIHDIYLLAHPLSEDEQQWLQTVPMTEVLDFLAKQSQTLVPNPKLLARIAEADLIIYAPGTQHSSLFPSYLTPGLGSAIAHNLTAIKLLITNLQEDAEIADSSAVDIINKAVYYLQEKNRLCLPTPCLITHYILNDAGHREPTAPYIPLGQIENLEDPRLVRVGNYEDGVTGRHDAAKILTPFIESFLKKRHIPKIAVLLLETDSLNKISQTILEMLRGGIQDVQVSVTVFYHSPQSFDDTFCASLPFALHRITATPAPAWLHALHEHDFDYVILFESSGMYRGEEVVHLASLLTNGHFDAVWGSRRLSMKDIHASYKLRYRHDVMLGAVSYLGSHVLSLAYLLLYGRYITDTLSGVRAVRAAYLRPEWIQPEHQGVNQHLLSLLLRNWADIFETPVQFFPISPEKIRRTTMLDGLRALWTILQWRCKALPMGLRQEATEDLCNA
jgi:hypothetical protein